jgi:hypothetical protein
MLLTRKPKIGDIYEVKLPSGLAYVQYTHEADDGTQLIRVLPGIYSRRPGDMVLLSQQKELYFIFTVLDQALRKKEVELVSSQPVPGWAGPFPTMRKAAGRTRDGKVLGWHIGHGLRLYTVSEMQQALYVRDLTPEQARLSIAQIWPVSTLAVEIERGWRPERAEGFEEAAREKRKEGEVYTGGIQQEAKYIDHYLYFPKRSNAERAAQQLRTKGWSVEVKMGADGKNWLVLAKQPAPTADDIKNIREELEQLAKEFHGEYDGWGAAV